MHTTTEIVEAPGVRFKKATKYASALFFAACPYGCRETTPTGRVKKNGGPKLHMHGGGGLGTNPSSLLTSRVAHCAGATGRDYVLTDPRRLVPTVAEVPR